jgi:hypothetical protein
MGFENVPVGLTNSVPTFSFVDGRKVKRSMDECVRVSDVDIFSKRKEFVTGSVRLRAVRRANQMRISRS